MRLLILLCLALTCRADVRPEAFLSAVRIVEGDNWSIAPGGYGLTRATWRQHSSLPYRFARYPTYAHEVALRHLAWLERSMPNPTVYELARAWRFGLRGGWGRESDYAHRVDNLYRR